MECKEPIRGWKTGKPHTRNGLSLDILGVAETWWPGVGECNVDNSVFFYSGNEDPKHSKGVGIIITREILKSVVDFVPYPDRTALLKLRAKPSDLNIIQVYAPTADSPDYDVERFYDEVKLTKKHDVNIIMGDFNAKIGRGKFEEIIGSYGLGERNERDDRLLQFSQEEGIKITNTAFQLHSRRLYTWKSPADRPANVIRNQIDFILINQRFSSTIKRASTYPGADVPSDHVILVSVMQIALSS
ncbi:craniofacial development protein 2-like [Sitophilus oryzae]|uniref:Craniofacial development protein 2-like n=1 Tax=Sitophilus oryzae TaxID=7048 RepID=A0A6J2Y5Y1_SITOR|nr:craniofacial development protein 2-like [Sitophilus oryzae]